MAARSERLPIFGRLASGLAAMLLALAIFGLPRAATAAVTCTTNGPALTFGTINPHSGFPYSTSGNVTYSCSNTSAAPVTIYDCFSIGTGSGGISATNRALASGGSTIPIQITGGSGYNQSIGDGTSYAMEGPLSVNVGANATVNGNIALAISMPQPSSAPPPGNYSSSFSGTDSQNLYAALSSSPASCAALASGSHQVAQTNFSIAATVQPQCTVSTTSLAFPTAALLSNPVAATATISTTCNATTPVTVALDNGATGSGPTARQMKSGGQAITYGIYLDAAATMPWGSTAGTNTASISGSGSLTAYGRVPAQAGVPPGSYSDVVNVVITY